MTDNRAPVEEANEFLAAHPEIEAASSDLIKILTTKE